MSRWTASAACNNAAVTDRASAVGGALQESLSPILGRMCSRSNAIWRRMLSKKPRSMKPTAFAFSILGQLVRVAFVLEVLRPTV